MNKLPLGALAALAATQLAGCIISSDNHDEAHITVSWQLKYVDSDVAEPCPVDYDTVAFYSEPVDANGTPVGPRYMEVFPCAAGSAVSAPLPPAIYQSWIEIIDLNTSAVYAQSLSEYVDVTVEDKAFHKDIFYDGGYFQFDWELVGAATAKPLECSDVPAIDHVKVTSFLSTSTQSVEDRFYNCEDHTGTTRSLLAGTYSILINPTDGGGEPLGLAEQFDGVAISGPNKVTTPADVGYSGPVVLPIDGL